MYVSNETLEMVGQSLVSDILYFQGAFTNFWNWVIDTWSIKEWNQTWDKVWDTKRYDEAYCDVNFLDTDHFIIETSHEKTD